MKWYVAESVDAERWHYAGESRDDAVALVQGEPHGGAVAHERVDQIDGTAFWQAVAAAICARLEMADEDLGEEGWIDCEDGWVSFDQGKLEEAMVEWLPTTGLERPNWRTIEDAEKISTTTHRAQKSRDGGRWDETTAT